MSIPGLDRWLETAQGRYVCAWESRRASIGAIADIFGFNALADRPAAMRLPARQPDPAAPEGGRMPARSMRSANSPPCPSPRSAPTSSSCPTFSNSATTPHQILREVERILIPEGQVIRRLQPAVAVGFARTASSAAASFPWNGSYLSLNRLKDWLQLLGFEVDRPITGLLRAALRAGCLAQALALHRKRGGGRWWGFSGGVYVLRAIKRTHAMRLITPKWRKAAVRAKALRPVAQKEGHEPLRTLWKSFTDGACKGNPGPGGWGAILRHGAREGTVGRRAGNDQQPHGTDGRHPRPRGAEAPGRRPHLHRLAICAEGHQRVDPRLEAQRLEDRRQEAGEERRPVAATRRRRPRATQARMDLGQGPRRPSGERTRRCPGQSRHRRTEGRA
jgi:hypothetical protein